ncbi:hypothetical protein [Natronorubrum thiooxidans]|nr:hypothetical protein [Natronorubrum thiooxidans]
MVVSDSVGMLSQTIEEYESDGGVVHQVDATIGGNGGELNVSVDVAVPLCGATTAHPGTEPTPQTATLEENGGLQIEFSPAAVPPIDEYTPSGVSSVRESVSVISDGTIVVTFALEFTDTEPDSAGMTADVAPAPDGNTDETVVYSERPKTDENRAAADIETAVSSDESKSRSPTEGMNASAHEPTQDAKTQTENETEHNHTLDSGTERKLASARNDDLPPYDDVEYLQCLYDTFDTFTAMADILEMDVASETVRRYMIDAGVHEPASYDTNTVVEDGADESAVENQLVADGIGLPEDIAIDELIDAIESSMTLYDVHRELDLERKQARELLEQLNLIDLVTKRLYDTDEPERRPSRNEIAERIRNSITPGQ